MGVDTLDFVKMNLGDPITNSIDADALFSDTVELDVYTRAIWCEVGGTVKMTLIGGGVITITAPNQQILPFRAKQIWLTGTSATGVKALW